MTLNNALRKNVLVNGLLVKKTPSVFLLLTTVKRNVEPRFLAGAFAFLQKEAKPLLTLLNVPKPMIVLRKLKLSSN